MMQRAHITACVTLLLTAGVAVAQANAAEWVSYRDAYRAMVVFDKYGGPKSLLQNALQVRPGARGMLDGGASLLIKGRTLQTSLVLDPLGRTTLPLLKAAYDENAVLAPNRALGGFTVRPRISLALRADGSYDVAELRAACEQALGFARYGDASARSQACVGVRLVFAKTAPEAGARVRTGGAETALPVTRAPAFAGDIDDDFPVVTYRFGPSDAAQVVTYNAPLAIVPLFE
ncbi:hypothetical protein AB2N08_17550 [Massilia aurea]|uniref:hypothetical protein n=1 Tax=Massilia aurea TaxID=373040 RepID=UPI003461EB87